MQLRRHDSGVESAIRVADLHGLDIDPDLDIDPEEGIDRYERSVALAGVGWAGVGQADLRPKAISVNKHTAWLVFSPAFCVAAAGTALDYAPAAAP